MTTDLNTDDLILWFDDLGSGNEEYRFLSNFYEGDPLTLPGIDQEFATGEHAFAAMKAWNKSYEDFKAIAEAPDPGTAKALGRQCALRSDWEVVKYDVMCAIVRTKFSPDREEGTRLLDTGDRLLVEGTYWYDRVWGVDLNDEARPGRNWLGTITMARRAELRALAHFGTAAVEDFVTGPDSTAKWNTRFSARKASA